MVRSRRLTAEQQFAATQKRDEREKEEQEQVRDQRAAQIARLRALRLAKENADAGDDES